MIPFVDTVKSRAGLAMFRRFALPLRLTVPPGRFALAPGMFTTLSLNVIGMSALPKFIP